MTTSFLNAGAFSHAIKFTIPKEDIERIKALVKSSPEFQPGDEFHWPFVDGVATANNKDNLTSPSVIIVSVCSLHRTSVCRDFGPSETSDEILNVRLLFKASSGPTRRRRDCKSGPAPPMASC